MAHKEEIRRKPTEAPVRPSSSSFSMVGRAELSVSMQQAGRGKDVEQRRIFGSVPHKNK